MTSLPPELARLIQAAGATVKAWRSLKAAHRDEVGPKMRAKVEKTLWSSLERLDSALGPVLALAKRPNEPIDSEKLFSNIMKGIELTERVVNRARLIGSRPQSRIIDVEPEE